MLILGGDRHMVSFNDAYLFKLNKGVESMPLYEWYLCSQWKLNHYHAPWASFKTATLALIEESKVSSISFFLAIIYSTLP